MAALIWDNELQAFTEAATPKIWDPALGAYEDTAGLTWNSELGAWEERWNQKIGALIPLMTSNTTPSGICASSSVYSADYPAWRAFNKPQGFTVGGINTNYDCLAFTLNAPLPQWVSYQFASAVKAVRLGYIISSLYTSALSESPKTLKVQASDDGQNWTDISGYLAINVDSRVWQYFALNTARKYFCYRLYITARNGSNSYMSIGGIQLYDNQEGE